VRGVDVLVRDDALIEVEAFDGERLPAAEDDFDVVLFVDVLHHTDHARPLLREARRVAKRWVVVKDHTRNGLLAGPTLRLMDRVGNARHGVALPFHYWSEATWHRVLAEEGFEIDRWQGSLGLYPFPSNLLFDRHLHFIARLGMTHG
jgi:SAM-dependent methyltransferase